MTATADGPDTALARLLYQRRRLALDTIQTCLADARRDPAARGTLAALLVERGLLPAREALDLVLALRTEEAGLSASSEAIFQEPTRRLQDAASGLATAAPTPPGEEETAARPASPPPPPEVPAPGARLGEWVVRRQLGAGSMGAVYLVESTRDGARYALKTLLGAPDPEDRARLLREAEAQARFETHRNLVRVRQAGEHAGTPFIVVDLVEGESLQQRFRLGPLPLPEALRVCIGVTRGLVHLHAHGVMHRDLKPGNVLLGGDGEVKLADFGLARFQGATSLTESGTVVGTPGYLAPELIQGARPGLGADVWALGCLIHAALTGTPPFGGGIAAMERAINETPPGLRSACAEAPEWLERLVARCLHRDPGERPAAVEVLRELERHAPAVGRRGTLALSLAAVGALSLAGGAAWRAADQAGDPHPLAAVASTPPGAPQPLAVEPQVDQAPASAPAAAFTVWALEPDRPLDVQLRVSGDVGSESSAANRTKIELERKYWFRWEPGPRAPERQEVTLTLRRVHVAWEWSGAQTDRGYLDSDRGETPDLPLRRALDLPATLVLDVRSGRVLEARGVERLQQAVLEGLPEGRQARFPYQLPELDSARSFAEAIDGVAAVLPADPAGSGPSWRLEREPPRALAQQVAPPVSCQASWRGTPGSALEWSGERTAEGQVGRVTRAIKGSARLLGGGLVHGEARERWEGAFRVEVSTELSVSAATR